MLNKICTPRLQIALLATLLSACGAPTELEAEQARVPNERERIAGEVFGNVVDAWSYGCANDESTLNFHINISGNEPEGRHTKHTQIRNLSYEINEVELTAADQANGRVFLGRIVFGEDTIKRSRNRSYSRWSEWEEWIPMHDTGLTAEAGHFLEGHKEGEATRYKYDSRGWQTVSGSPFLSLLFGDGGLPSTENVC